MSLRKLPRDAPSYESSNPWRQPDAPLNRQPVHLTCCRHLPPCGGRAGSCPPDLPDPGGILGPSELEGPEGRCHTNLPKPPAVVSATSMDGAITITMNPEPPRWRMP